MSAFRHEYRCGDGHEISAPIRVVIGRCPVYVDGKACSAEIKRVGAGSRGPRKTVKAAL